MTQEIEIIPTLPLYVGMECEHLRGHLSESSHFRLFVSGPFGIHEIDNLIRILETQKAVITVPPDTPKEAGSETPKGE